MFALFAQLTAEAQRPKLGLTLSGGGAKGLAHIGILQAIDSAGLQVDLVTGTSMGSVVGALYSIGYTGNQIDSITRKIDWNVIFSPVPDGERIPVDKKKDNEEQIFELKLKGLQLQPITGVLESQELWILLSELLMPAYHIKDFDSLHIPFRCVATDVLTGDAVIHSGGNLVYAVRSSMAIPSIFTAVNMDDRLLIDGGVVRNFPARDAREMGADILIGVNVSASYLPPDQMNSAINILYQTAFLRSSEDFEAEMALCDQYIDVDVSRFTAGSFNASDSILAIGKAAGDQYYPYFKHLADSLNAIEMARKRLPLNPLNTQILVRGITIEGLVNTTRTAFLERLGLVANMRYSPDEISNAVREVYATRLFKSITFDLQPNPAGGAAIHFRVQEYPTGGLNVGFHYNSFSNIALILNYRIVNLLTDKSETSARLAIGDNSHLRLRQEQYLGRRLNHKLSLSMQLDRVFLPEFVNYSQRQLFKEQMVNFSIQYDRLIRKNSMTGIGIRHTIASWRPRLLIDENVSIDNRYNTAYIHLIRHNLKTLNYPSRGAYTRLRVEYVFNQQPNIEISGPEGAIIAQDASPLNAYFRTDWRIETYTPLSDRLTWLLHSMGGINFTTTDALFNFWNVGGQFDLFRNQIVFPGFREFELQGNGIGVVQAGLQRQLSNRLFFVTRFSGGVIGLNQLDLTFGESLSFFWGTSAAFGFRSPIGPVDASLNYNVTNNTWIGQLNLGWWF